MKEQVSRHDREGVQAPGPTRGRLAKLGASRRARVEIVACATALVVLAGTVMVASGMLLAVGLRVGDAQP